MTRIRSIALSGVAALALGMGAISTAPSFAAEMTKMVGGAAMYPSKNIVQNAVNSKDHTTLVAAVKAAGLVPTLEVDRPVHGVRADQRSLRETAGRHRRHAAQAREQGASSPASSPITSSPAG